MSKKKYFAQKSALKLTSQNRKKSLLIPDQDIDDWQISMMYSMMEWCFKITVLGITVTPSLYQRKYRIEITWINREDEEKVNVTSK